MQAKYSIGEIVKIKATGEKVKIQSLYPPPVDGIEYFYFCEHKLHGYHESELKPFCPSRSGVRGKDGKFVKRQLPQEAPLTCPFCFQIAEKCKCSLLRKVLSHAQSVKKSNIADPLRGMKMVGLDSRLAELEKRMKLSSIDPLIEVDKPNTQTEKTISVLVGKINQLCDRINAMST